MARLFVACWIFGVSCLWFLTGIVVAWQSRYPAVVVWWRQSSHPTSSTLNPSILKSTNPLYQRHHGPSSPLPPTPHPPHPRADPPAAPNRSNPVRPRPRLLPRLVTRPSPDRPTRAAPHHVLVVGPREQPHRTGLRPPVQRAVNISGCRAAQSCGARPAAPVVSFGVHGLRAWRSRSVAW